MVWLCQNIGVFIAWGLITALLEMDKVVYEVLKLKTTEEVEAYIANM